MKFNLTMENPPAPGGSSSSGSSDGTYEVMPEAVRQVLADVQAQAVEFGSLSGEAGTEMMELSDACKAPPITAELSSLYTSVFRRAIDIAGGRTVNAVDAVAQAVTALVQGDEQMGESARKAAAQAAQEHADDAPGAGDRPRSAGRGSVQAF